MRASPIIKSPSFRVFRVCGACRPGFGFKPCCNLISRNSRGFPEKPRWSRWKSVSADLLTPVSAFLAIAENEPHAFLLESVERGEQIGRYTFLGARPYMKVRARQGTV